MIRPTPVASRQAPEHVESMNEPSQNLSQGNGFGAVSDFSEPAGCSESWDQSLRRQQAVVALGRRAIAPPDLPILMQDAAELIGRMTDADYSAVAELAADGRAMTLRISFRDPETHTTRDVVEQISADPVESLAGYALQVGHPVRSADLSAETRFGDLALRRQGIKAGLAVPLRLQSQAFGALLACSGQPRSYDEADSLFAETIAHLVTTTVARCRAEGSLTTDRQLATGVLETVDAIVLVLDCKGCIQHANKACEKLTGFSRDELSGRQIGNVFPVPQEASLFSVIFDKLRRGSSPVHYESQLLTKHSEKRQIAWSYAAVENPDSSLKFVIATGLDITEQREHQARAERAERARQSLAEQLAAAAGQPLDPAQAATVAENAAAAGPFPLASDPLQADRRKRPRRSFPYRQRLAPIFDGKLPNERDFVEIDCNDIGVGGFSYLSPKPPETETVVIELGNSPNVTRMIAQIAHVTRMSKEGGSQYLVGCSYTGRVP